MLAKCQSFCPKSFKTSISFWTPFSFFMIGRFSRSTIKLMRIPTDKGKGRRWDTSDFRYCCSNHGIDENFNWKCLNFMWKKKTWNKRNMDQKSPVATAKKSSQQAISEPIKEVLTGCKDQFSVRRIKKGYEKLVHGVVHHEVPNLLNLTQVSKHAWCLENAFFVCAGESKVIL